MKVRHFDQMTAMEQESQSLLGRHFALACPEPHAVMLTGGGTPLGLYRRIEKSPPPINDRLHLLVSDERHVPISSPESNFGNMKAMVSALGVADSRLIRVDTELALDDAARQYHQALASYIERGGRITLGILGLGADGHLASLFKVDDIHRGAGKYAIAVPRTPPPDRISVTRDLLLKVEKLVFMVAGEEKTEIIDKVAQDSSELVSVQAVHDMIDVEFWFCK